MIIYSRDKCLFLHDWILIGVENGATQQKPHFSFEGEICMHSSGCIMAVTISFAFSRECWVTQSNTNATFLKCSFACTADENRHGFLSSGVTRYIIDHVDETTRFETQLTKMSKPTINASTEKAKTRSSEVYDTPNEPEVKNRNQSQEIKRIDQVYDMVKSMMAKLDTLDEIKERILCVERDVGHMKD